MPIAFICPKIPPTRNGVGDYTYCLASEIAKTRPVTIITSQSDRPPSSPGLEIHYWDGRGMKTLRPILDRVRPAFINVQWVPFLWGRWGINFRLPWTVLRLRGAGYSVITTVHEPYVGFDRLKTLPMAIIHRLELWTLILGSTKVAVSIPEWTQMLQSRFFWRKSDFFWLPVGSSIPRLPLTDSERAEVRHRLGLGAADVLVVMFNPGGSGKMVDLAAKAWNAILRANPTARLLLIGCKDSDPLTARFSALNRVLCTGFTEPAEVSRFMSCGDLCLAPFIDGISARRSSAIAALAHGLPIVSTKGPLTDLATFASSPMALTEVGDERAFVAAAERLASDSARRKSLHQALIEFHRRNFAWSFIADSLLARAAS